MGFSALKSLYGRLFAYRERPARRPLEDFLTEALCDILNRLSQHQMREMVEFVSTFLLPTDAREAWREQVYDYRGLAWITQVPIGASGRVDLLLRNDVQPLIIIENKITDPHTQRLRDYGLWLKEKCEGHKWPGAIVFLTHLTAPPEGFGDRDPAYGVRWQQICRWPAVCKWLATAAQEDSPDGRHSVQRILRDELAIFLKEKSMTSETMTLHDLSAAEIYVSSAARVNQLFKRIWEEAVKPDWGPMAYKHDAAQVERSVSSYDSEGAVLWDWIYLRPPHSAYDGDVWFLAWGIGFPAVGGDWWKDAAPSLPSRTYAFVCLSTTDGERKSLPTIAANIFSSLGAGWSISPSSGNNLIKAQPMCVFDPDPERLADQMIKWVAESAAQLRQMLPGLVNAAQHAHTQS